MEQQLQEQELTSKERFEQIKEATEARAKANPPLAEQGDVESKAEEGREQERELEQGSLQKEGQSSAPSLIEEPSTNEPPPKDRDERLAEAAAISSSSQEEPSQAERTSKGLEQEEERTRESKKKPSASVAEFAASKSDREGEKTPKGKILEKIWEERQHEGNEHHDLLLKLIGEWNAEYAFAGPAPGHIVRGHGHMTAHPLWDGKFVELNHKQKMGDFDFEGRGLLSYSPHQNEFHSAWFDNTSTSMHPSHGGRLQREDEKRGFELSSYSPFPDFFSGKMKTTRQVYEFDSDDRITFSSYDRVEGIDDERQTMYIIYRRRGSRADTGPSENL